MNAVLFGTSPTAVAFAKMLKNSESMQQVHGITLDGVMCKTLRETTDIAIELDIRAYAYFEDAIRNADILLIAYPDSSIPKFVSSLKEQELRGKILCHFSNKYDSGILSCGTTNSCYSIALPYYRDTLSTNKENTGDSVIIIEGGGKRDEEFREALTDSLPKIIFSTKHNKKLCDIARRIVSICIMSCLEITMHIFKIIGIYDKNDFITFIKDSVNASLSGNLPVGKIDRDELKKNFRLLGTINYSDTKDFYRNMETHVVNNGTYTFDEKEELMRVLKYNR